MTKQIAITKEAQFIDCIRFVHWITYRVKSNHLSNEEQMSLAINKVINNN